MDYYTIYFGQAYGEGAYGTGTYSCTQEQIDAGTCTTAAGGGTTPGGGSGGGLADTGLAIVGIVTLACLLIFVALTVRIWRRPKLAMQEATAVTPEQQPADDATQRSE